LESSKNSFYICTRFKGQQWLLGEAGSSLTEGDLGRLERIKRPQNFFLKKSLPNRIKSFTFAPALRALSLSEHD